MSQNLMWCLVDKKTGASSAPIRLNTAYKIGRPTPSGSEVGVDVAIKGDSSISRLHAEILIKKPDEESPPHIVVTDHSKFGIWVNGEKIDGFKNLKESDEITFGVYGSCFTLEAVKLPNSNPSVVKKETTGTSQSSSISASVNSTLKSKTGSPTQAGHKSIVSSCVYRKGKPPKDAIKVKTEQLDQPAEAQIRIKVKSEPLVVKNYQNLHNSCITDLGTASGLSTNGGKLNFKKFKKIPKASVLKHTPHGLSASTGFSSTSTMASAASNSTTTGATASTRLKQKRAAKLENSQFMSFKNEPFDVDSQFLSFMSQNNR